MICLSNDSLACYLPSDSVSVYKNILFSAEVFTPSPSKELGARKEMSLSTCWATTWVGWGWGWGAAAPQVRGVR